MKKDNVDLIYEAMEKGKQRSIKKIVKALNDMSSSEVGLLEGILYKTTQKGNK